MITRYFMPFWRINLIKNNTTSILDVACKLIFFPVLLLSFHQTHAEIQFTEITVASGISHSDETWGANWTDINNDYFPDLFISNHRSPPSLYRNNRNGTFTEISDDVIDESAWNGNIIFDKHGAAFADFDNDGDTDIFFRTGGAYRNRLFINEDDMFTEKGLNNGIGDIKSGKSSTVIDYDNDGLLDILAGEHNWRGTGDGFFTDANIEIEKTCNTKSNAIAISDYNDDGSLEIICVVEGEFPQNIFNTKGLPFKSLKTDLPPVSLVNNFVIADFDNDLDFDFYLTRGFLRPTESILVNQNRMETWLQSSSNIIRGTSFVSDGTLTITSSSNFFNSSFDIYIGENEIQPVTTGSSGSITYSIPYDANYIEGISANSGNNRLHIGRLNGRWHIETPLSNNASRGYIIVDSTEAITDIETYGTGVGDKPIINSFLINENPTFIDKASTNGFNNPVSCVSAGAADFDNDMDLDLYLACTTSTSNIANRLYLNDGTGTFTETLSHGAEGAIGQGLESGAGTADSALLADYDLDGYIDIVLTNGLGLRPLYQGGPHQLFKNTTVNSNHWIQLHLIGVTSNRDGVGAKIIATTNGNSQIREMHFNNQRWGHHDKAIHFGLGGNTQVNITVKWPNGAENTYTDLEADQIYTLKENGLAEIIVPENGLPHPDLHNECGINQPQNQTGNILLWKDCLTGIWSFRTITGISNSSVNYTGKLQSENIITAITQTALEANDDVTLNNIDNILSFNLVTESADTDGFDFLPVDEFSTCLKLESPPNTAIKLGKHNIEYNATSINLGTLMECSETSIATIPWNESFNDLTNGSIKDGGDTPWTARRASGIFGVFNQQMLVKGSGDEFIWLTGTIDISSFNAVSISAEVTGITGVDSSDDYIQLLYSIDGNNAVIGDENTDALPLNTIHTLKSEKVTGNTIQIFIKARVSGYTENYMIDNILIAPDESTQTTGQSSSGGGGCYMSNEQSHMFKLEWILIMVWVFLRFISSANLLPPNINRTA